MPILEGFASAPISCIEPDVKPATTGRIGQKETLKWFWYWLLIKWIDHIRGCLKTNILIDVNFLNIIFYSITMLKTSSWLQRAVSRRLWSVCLSNVRQIPLQIQVLHKCCFFLNLSIFVDGVFKMMLINAAFFLTWYPYRKEKWKLNRSVHIQYVYDNIHKCCFLFAVLPILDRLFKRKSVRGFHILEYNILFSVVPML